MTSPISHRLELSGPTRSRAVPGIFVSFARRRARRHSLNRTDLDQSLSGLILRPVQLVAAGPCLENGRPEVQPDAIYRVTKAGRLPVKAKAKRELLTETLKRWDTV